MASKLIGWLVGTMALISTMVVAAQAADTKVDAEYKKAKADLADKSGAELATGLEALAVKQARQHDEAENYSGAEAWALANAAYEWMKLGLADENAKRDATANFNKAAADYSKAAACEKIRPECKEIVDRNVERLTKRGIKVTVAEKDEGSGDQQK